REQQLQWWMVWRAHVPPTLPQHVVFSVRRARADGFDRGAPDTGLPRPSVPIPEMRQDVNRGRIGSAIDRHDAAEDVFGVCLGVLDEYIEIAVAQESFTQGIEQFEFTLGLGALTIDLHELVVRISDLRILIQHLHVGMRRRSVEEKVILLYIFTVV